MLELSTRRLGVVFVAAFTATVVAVAMTALPDVARGQSAATPPPAPAPAPAPQGGVPNSQVDSKTGDAILSNETTLTTWTTADYAQKVYTQPSTRSRTITRLRFTTPDGFLQSYIVLRQRHTARGAWVQLRLPMRPNGLTGWVRREALDTFSVVHTQLVLDRGQHRVTLYRDGNVVLSAPVGVGKASTPTPPGRFWITEKFAVHSSPVYGPYAFGTSDYSVLTDWPGGGIVGLHGTNEPQFVPGNPSHGCIRLHNTDILRLSKLVSIGTPLLIT